MTETLDDLTKKIALYESNGAAKAAYAINRKLNELSDMLNSKDISKLDIADPKDKTFERLKIAWGEMASLSEAYKTLAATAGITGDEAKDSARKPFNDRIAESRN